MRYLRVLRLCERNWQRRPHSVYILIMGSSARSALIGNLLIEISDKDWTPAFAGVTTNINCFSGCWMKI